MSDLEGETIVKSQVAVLPAQLRRTWDAQNWSFRSTQELPALLGLVGQERAVRALQFGLTMRSHGYNIYVAGAAGTGRTSYSRSLAEVRAAAGKVPSDWVYVHNFDQPDEPLALELPAGAAPNFARQVAEALEEIRSATMRALNTREYHAGRDGLVQRMRQAIDEMMEELQHQAQAAGFGLAQNEQGVSPVPLFEGRAMTEEQFDALPAAERQAMKEGAQQLQVSIAEARRRTLEMEQKLEGQMRSHDLQVVRTAMAPVLRRLTEQYASLPLVTEWLGRVERELAGRTIPDMPQNKAMQEAAAAQMQSMLMRRQRPDPMGLFRVNVFIHRVQRTGAPVVVESNPTYANLFGKAEVTDGRADEGLMQIKAGAIHRANGGYLILQAADVLQSPFAWEALKRALSTREARIEPPGHENRLLPTPELRPRHIPLDVKVILVGSPGLYQALYAQDDGFRKLFKIKAEFDGAMESTEANAQGYAEFIASVCNREGLRHFTADGVGQILEYSHRLADDQTKLSARFNEVVEIIYEANAWAEQSLSDGVEAAHVIQAIRAKADRSALPEVNLQEMIRRGTILVDVDGAVVGQVNGLTVMRMGDHSFGAPSRITARVYMGQKGILHIEREIAMSGQIHDKGVLTLAGFLGDRFAQERPLALSASIAFEQSYVPVDGDSASSTELYALLSALAELPIDQGIAVTGSVNQRGQVQPIGGVNEKIEGFFRICAQAGLTGRQGVLIPRRNLSNLMLSADVVDAVGQGRFHVWAVESIEEGIEVLTGVPAVRVFDRVDQRLRSFAERLQDWSMGDLTEA